MRNTTENLELNKVFIRHDTKQNLTRSKNDWIKFFKAAKIQFHDIEKDFDIDFFDDSMPDFYFPKVDFGGDFFGVLNYTPFDIYYKPYYSNDLFPIDRGLKYLKFLSKNKKPIVFFKDYIDFKPTTVLYYSDKGFKARLGIPFAYLLKKTYGNIWHAAGDEDFNDWYPYKKIINQIAIKA